MQMMMIGENASRRNSAVSVVSTDRRETVERRVAPDSNRACCQVTRELGTESRRARLRPGRLRRY